MYRRIKKKAIVKRTKKKTEKKRKMKVKRKETRRRTRTRTRTRTRIRISQRGVYNFKQLKMSPRSTNLPKYLFSSKISRPVFTQRLLKVKGHKNENFFGFDFEFCTVSLLVMLKYEGFVKRNFSSGHYGGR